jgi:hypothetical protein
VNIFYLDRNPVTAAQAMTDKHVVKMILESAQLLSTAHRVLDGIPTVVLSKSGARLTRYAHSNDLLYKSTHVNHPSAIWVRQSVPNYEWLYRHFCALCDEYTRRYTKVHATDQRLRSVLATLPTALSSDQPTVMPCAMPDQYKYEGNPVLAYRHYYVKEKLHMPNDIARFYDILDIDITTSF